MKVLHLINSLNIGGAETLLADSLSLYAQENIEVDLLLLNGNKTGLLDKLLATQCCTIASLGKTSVYNPLLVFKLIPYLKDYDIIHVHLFPGLYWLAFAKFISFAKVKIIYTEHSTSNRRRNHFIYKITDKIIYSFYTKIITISDAVDVQLKKHLRFNDSKFVLINNGININKFKKAKPYKKDSFFSANDKIIVQVSSFRKPKDQPTLIRAIKRLPVAYKLLMVGEGPLLQKNRELVKNLNLQDRVLFLENRIDVPCLLKTADVIVLSSYHEGLSLSSIEAMASERPFIASDVPGLTEVVKGAGILFEKENDLELSEQIIKLMDNESYYNQIVSKCVKRSEKYDINTMVKNYSELYKDILSKPLD